MNQTLMLASLLTLLGTAGMLQAQNAQSHPTEPQYVNVFYAIDANGTLIPLEHNTDVTFHSKVKPLPGYASVKTLVEFEPGRSSVRLNAEVAHFVIRDRAPIDPSLRYELRLLRSSKKHRQFEMTRGHGTLLGGSATSTLDDNAVALRFDDYGINSYRITPEHRLAAGEYSFSLRGVVSDLYCFGIDY